MITSLCNRYHASQQRRAPACALSVTLSPLWFSFSTRFAPTPHSRCSPPDNSSPAVTVRAGSVRHPEVTMVDIVREATDRVGPRDPDLAIVQLTELTRPH
ncbi:hypothetical protein ACH47C_40470 [Streptomyces rishiriensis]|uniref:hypothetical protein n=1 Tax=Streptomyces rishiriensis TaxID=68264 RepID=UPI001C3F9E4B|nr:hypothetical protein [Streptomyces rishiriensis]